MLESVDRELQELGRTAVNQHPLNDLRLNRASWLTTASTDHENSVLTAFQDVLQVAEILPFDSQVLTRALGYRSLFDSLQDAIVLGSVVQHLESIPGAGESCFLNRNSKDFDDPNVRDLLERLECKVLSRFDQGLQYLRSRLSRP